MKRRILAAGAVVVAASGGGIFLALQGSNEQPAQAKSVKTATVERGDLVDTENVSGTLTYGDERTVTAGSSGTVTWTPAEGAVIHRGKTLVKIDSKPITLMFGKIPMYRALSSGSEGKDVKQLETNLKALGYGDDLTVDEDYTSATASAVEDWQEDRGLEETGTVDANQIVFQPGALRIKEIKAAVGAHAPAQFTVTGTVRTVHVDLAATSQNLARLGAKATVNLPGGDSFDGRITTVGTVAKKASEDSEETIDVDISLGRAKTGKIDQAPVTVDLESERSKNVLSVPVEALIALSEGGFGVELSANGATSLVGVTPGVFGDGRVEVTGQGLKEGMKVTVPNG